MPVLPSLQKKTYEDYAGLPEGAPYQLIDGELIMSPAPIPYHQLISRRLESLLLRFVEDKKLGEVLHAPIDVFFDQYETYQPDIIFISNQRLGIIGAKKIEGAPDLIMEILSPSTKDYDLGKKKKVYERFGVLEYWIVDPKRKNIEIFGMEQGRFVLLQDAESGSVRSRLLVDCEVELAAIFKPFGK